MLENFSGKYRKIFRENVESPDVNYVEAFLFESTSDYLTTIFCVFTSSPLTKTISKQEQCE